MSRDPGDDRRDLEEPARAGREPGHPSEPGREPERGLEPGRGRGPERVRDLALLRDRPSRHGTSARVLLQHVGMFRAVEVEDLARIAYGGEVTPCTRDVSLLGRRQLVATYTMTDPRRHRRLAFVTLTSGGVREAVRDRSDPNQQLYGGLARRAALVHDSTVYRMYDAEASRIARAGGRISRVVLECELMRGVMRSLKAAGNAAVDFAALRPQIAEQSHLRVVFGAIQIPDLRLEYENAAGEFGRVDLELVTEHYDAVHLAAKALAGFTLYAPAGDATRSAAILQQRHIAADILTL
jgi:hypothetical protein